MIYLITGGMGTGKTSMVVDMILNNYEGIFKTEAEDGTQIDRPLYFCHIDGLNKEKFKAHELKEEEIQEKPLREIVPVGSVVIVDECDYTYPVRAAGRDAPPFVKTLKEIRHEGITLILMTQHPTMIDKYVRNLVNKHIHLERKQVGTMRYEWFRCEESLNSTAFSTGAGKFYSPPKQAFEYYTSSAKHVKFKKKRHIVFYIFPILLIVFIYQMFHVWGNFSKNLEEENKEAQTLEQIASQPNFDFTAIPNLSASAPRAEPIGGKIEDYLPRVANMPETAPINDNLRVPVNMENIAGCVSQKNSCNCYSSQGTKIFVSETVCRYYAENGIFHRYKKMDNQAVNS